MKRGELYRVYKPHSRDPKRFYTNCTGLETQVDVGIDEGLKHDSRIFCDEIVSFPKSMLTDFVGSLSEEKLRELNEAVKIALVIK